MVTFQNAWGLLQGIDLLTPPETVSIDAAVGRISYLDVLAVHDSPPFDQSRYDGYALGEGRRTYTIVSDQPITAGDGSPHALGMGAAIPIMTGAPLPRGTRAIVPGEWCKLEGTTLSVNRFPDKHSMWLKKGSNFSTGEIYIKRGDAINPMHVAFMALDGKARVQVFSRPTLMVISSGDELASYEEPTLGQAMIRNSHPALIQALLVPDGIVIGKIHIPDRVDVMEKTLKEALQSKATIVITTGGLGQGVKDLTRKVLHEIGCIPLFEGVKAIPIGTFSCYQYGEKIVFSLPGGMVGVMLLSKLYIVPFIRKIQGLLPSPSLGPFRLTRLKGDSRALLKKRRNGMIRFVKARLWTEGNSQWVSPLDPATESLTKMNAFILSGDWEENGENVSSKVPIFPLWES